MNTHIFIVGSVSTTDTVESLSPGEFQVFGMNTVTTKVENLSIDTVTPQGYDFGFLALGSRGSYNGIATPTLVGRSISKPRVRNRLFRKNTYRAGAKLVFTLTSSTNGTTSFDEFEVHITTENGNLTGVNHFTKTYMVTGQFATATLLYAALATEINKDMWFDSVTSSAAGVVITARVGQELTVTFNQYPATLNALPVALTVVKSGNFDVGSGNPEQIAQLVKDNQIWLGQHYQDSRVFTNSDALFPVVGNSDMYYIRWTNSDQIDESQTEVAFNIYQEHWLVVATGTDMSGPISQIEKLMGTKMVTSL